MQEVLRVTLPTLYPMPILPSILRDATAAAIVAEAGGKFCGFIVARFVLDEMEIITFAVDSAWQRKGIGAKLMDALIAFAREKRMKKIFLEVAASNAAAQALYRQKFFAESGLRRDYYLRDSGIREDAVIFTLDLNS